MAQATASPLGERWNRVQSSQVGTPGQNAASDRGGSRAGAGNALLARLKGPGGYYNMGNAIALTTGLGVQIASASSVGEHGPGAVLAAVRQYFVGSPGATALTLAIGIFFVSGEMYHRAWSRGFPPDRRMNWWGDFLSGVAAIVLTLALAAFGDVLLAVASGLLLSAGKFGSALRPENYNVPGDDPWPNRFRVAVLASRVPALMALAFEFVRLLGADALATGSLVMTSVMLGCYLLWARADLLLFARESS